MAQKNLLGQNIFGYNVTELLGEGAFGTVYKIEKTNASGKYIRALKHITIPNDRQYSDVLNSMGGNVSKADDYFAEMLKGIVSEIQILNDLSEKGIPHIVRYYENEIVTTESPRQYDIYIMMEYLEPLEDFVTRNEFTVHNVVRLGIDILGGLSACHENGVIHRDIKDDNIFVSAKGEYKIGDFGVSKILKNSSKAESLKGTPNFLAPEVYLGKESYTKSVDLYSLGIVLYRLLNYNRNPFLPKFPEQFYANDEDAAFEKRMNGETPDLPSLGGKYIGDVIVKAISNRDSRFQSAEEFMYALEEAAQNTSEDVLSAIVKYNAFISAANGSNHKYDTTFGDASASGRNSINEETSSSSAVNQHLFDTMGELPGTNVNDSAPIVDTGAIRSRIDLISLEGQSYVNDSINGNHGGNQQRGGGILKKIMLFLLPLMIVFIGAGAYFFVWPEFNENIAQSYNSTKTEKSQTSPEESDNKLTKLKESRFKCLGKDIKAYSNGLYYKEYDDTSSFNMGGVSYKRGFVLGTYKEGGYANFNLGGNYKYIAGLAGCVDGVYCTVTYNVLGDNELIGTIEVKQGYLPTAFEFEVTGIKQLSFIATGKDNHGDGVGFGNVCLYNDKVDKPNLYETSDLPKIAYLGKDIKSYVSGLYYKEYDGMDTFNMGGEKYSKGFTIGTYKNGGFASFNIDGKYKSLSGVAGNVDQVNYSVTYNVLADGQSIGTIDIKGGGLPTAFNFDVTGVKQINIIAMGKNNHGNGVGFADVVLQ